MNTVTVTLYRSDVVITTNNIDGRHDRRKDVYALSSTRHAFLLISALSTRVVSVGDSAILAEDDNKMYFIAYACNGKPRLSLVEESEYFDMIGTS